MDAPYANDYVILLPCHFPKCCYRYSKYEGENNTVKLTDRDTVELVSAAYGNKEVCESNLSY